ncbi:hypothetical protein DSM106972_066140 [Dulcicalothrix desertica PCC 7102]|uniref:DUF2808 domain-containing protein n=1 Tax=Dulcicalothrix desertica PCC 7102 TaxID=232991 RepID=A0A433V606_9CYAN|nr:DUF2808 domain-containing protein [Dulcicalothrix desertica]RUT01517.1 hypothetical protein DSM106972_066140 [Dulcicalothrix desertica PCC 7102]
MNKLVYAAAFTLVISSIAPAFAGNLNDANVSHLGDSAAIPNYAQDSDATHRFDIHVQGKAISELMINLPEDVKINRGVEVRNKSGQKIPATVSINDKKVTVAFSEAVNPGTSLSVNMKGVSTPGYEKTWHYPVSVKKVGIKEESSLGLARVQTYGS